MGLAPQRAGASGLTGTVPADAPERACARISRVEWRLLRRLVAAGALEPGRADPLPGLRGAPAGWLARLEARGLLRRGAGATCYVDGATYRRARRRRWAAVAVTLTVAAALLLGLFAMLRAG